jgi:hypothetical protein
MVLSCFSVEAVKLKKTHKSGSAESESGEAGLTGEAGTADKAGEGQLPPDGVREATSSQVSLEAVRHVRRYLAR